MTVLLMLAHFRALENFRFLLLMACAGLEVKTLSVIVELRGDMGQ